MQVSVLTVHLILLALQVLTVHLILRALQVLSEPAVRSLLILNLLYTDQTKP